MGTEMSAVVTVGAERIHRRRKEQARTAGGAVGGGPWVGPPAGPGVRLPSPPLSLPTITVM